MEGDTERILAKATTSARYGGLQHSGHSFLFMIFLPLKFVAAEFFSQDHSERHGVLILFSQTVPWLQSSVGCCGMAQGEVNDKRCC